MKWMLLLAWAASFTWQEEKPGVLSLAENGATVLAYHHGAGRECCYVHPLVSPAGVVLTDDGPVDHKHHRGLFWAWPVMEMGGTRADSWTLTGAEHRLVEIFARKTSNSSARLASRHEWRVDGKPALAEEMELIVYKAQGAERRLTLTIVLRALERPVSIAGAPEQNKGYGGVSIRFAPRQETRIESSEGPVAKDENHNRHRWAQLEAQFAGGRAGVRIEADRRNPQFPNDWCLRHYGFVGANFPGVTPYRIDPAKPITLRYEIRVFDRPAAAARPSLP